jgi:putative glutamine transport system substrate-binding protein
VLELENYAEAFTALQSGQGDAMTTDNSILLGMAAENPQYILAGDKFTDEPYGIALNKGQEEFQSALNEGLEKIRENGEYRKIYKKWFNEEPK